ncbi:hypothetical protein [Tautonia sociabilis]|uniref:hypothetical protein n=1 Tax=Tautonia sociabilis TaxID=2080755 RepID=UPI0013150476|nr:hypothetical protein [Tautonia sociabilis]
MEPRTLLNGSPDPSFGRADLPGRATLDLDGLAEVSGVAVQDDGAVLVAGTVRRHGNDDFAVARFLPDGTPDPGFGASGVATIAFDLGFGDDVDDAARALAVQPDGRILVVGPVERSGGQLDFGVARLMADGSPDTSFGLLGRVVFGFDRGGSLAQLDDIPRAAAVQPDGRILVVGSVDDVNDENDVGVLRLLANGSLDPSFGSGGRAVIGFDLGQTDADRDDDPAAVLLQPDGRVVIAAAVDLPGGDRDFGLVRLLADGGLDPGFGSGGRVVVGFNLGDQAARRIDLPTALALQPDGRIVVAGSAEAPGSRSDFALLRLLPDGSPDASFDGDGRVNVHVGAGLRSGASAVAVHPDGRIVAAGNVQDAGGDSDFGALQIDPTGAADPGFGAGGGVVLPFDLGGTFEDRASGAALDSTGRLVIGGRVEVAPGTFAIGAARLFTDSSPPFVVRIVPVEPELRTEPVDSIDVVLSEPIDPAVLASSLTLSRDGSPLPAPGAMTVGLVPGSWATYRVSGIGEATSPEGHYQFLVDASGLRDPAGNPGTGSASVSFRIDRTGPTILRLSPIGPDPRGIPLLEADVEFSEPIDLNADVLGAFSLSRDGVAVPLGEGVTLEPVPGSATSYRLVGLSGATSVRGSYRISVDATVLRDLAGNPGTGSASSPFTVLLRAVPADYDGDGTSDLATYTESDGVGRFTIRNSRDGSDRVVPLGGPGDVPVDGDYDGDGIIDPAVFGFDPSLGSSRFLIQRSSDGTLRSIPFGGPFDFPIGGDYDGDGITDLAVFGYSPLNGSSRYAIVYSSGAPSLTFPFGGLQDFPVAGDYDGDGITDVAVSGYSPRNGFSRFGVVYSSGRPTLTLPFGGTDDRPVAGDYDGDGITDVAVYGYSPRNGFSRFGVVYSSGRPTLTLPFGGADDLPVGGDYDGDGTTDVAVYGYSSLNGFSRFGILLSGGSPTRTEPFGTIGSIGLPPFPGLFRIQNGAGPDGPTSPDLGTTFRKASSIGVLGSLPDGSSSRAPSPPDARWAGLFDLALLDPSSLTQPRRGPHLRSLAGP